MSNNIHNRDLFDGTRLSSISPERSRNRRNKSGVTGVRYREDRRCWVARICFQGKEHDLGQFERFEDAVEARHEAEERLYGPVLERHAEDRKTKHLPNQTVVDLTGTVYPHFKVTKSAGYGHNKSRLWVCECTCGNTFIATSSEIRNNRKVSCGCMKKEEKEQSNVPKLQCGQFYVEGTTLGNISSKVPHKRNRSGVKGIYQDRCGTWYAKLCFKGVTHRVRCSSRIQAVYQRAMLEEKYFDPTIRKYSEWIRKED